MSKFKVGDRVMIIGTISGTVIDVNSNGVVVECDEPSKGVEICQYPNKMVLWPNESQVELIAPSRYELHITCNDGKTTNAVYKVNGKIEKRTQAICAPSDTFSFNIGAELAVNRVLYGTDYNPKDVALKPTQPIALQEDKPKFVVGQRVIGTRAGWTKDVKGTILIVGTSDLLVSFDKHVDPSFGRGNDKFCAYQNEQDVEPYTEPEKIEPEYLNMTVVFVGRDNSGKFWTEGKPYMFINGNVIANDGKNYYYESSPVKTLKEANKRLMQYGKFIKFLGE